MRLPRKRKKQVSKRRQIADALNTTSKALSSAVISGKELEAWLKSRSYHE